MNHLYEHINTYWKKKTVKEYEGLKVQEIESKHKEVLTNCLAIQLVCDKEKAKTVLEKLIETFGEFWNDKYYSKQIAFLLSKCDFIEDRVFCEEIEVKTLGLFQILEFIKKTKEQYKKEVELDEKNLKEFTELIRFKKNELTIDTIRREPSMRGYYREPNTIKFTGPERVGYRAERITNYEDLYYWSIYFRDAGALFQDAYKSNSESYVIYKEDFGNSFAKYQITCYFSNDRNYPTVICLSEKYWDEPNYDFWKKIEDSFENAYLSFNFEEEKQNIEAKMILTQLTKPSSLDDDLEVPF